MARDDAELMELLRERMAGRTPAPAPVAGPTQLTEPQAQMFPGFDASRGAGWLDRLRAATTANETGEANFYRSKYGAENVRPVWNKEGTEITGHMITTPDGSFMADPSPSQSGFFGDIMGDIADLTGTAIETIPGAVLGGIGAATLGPPGAIGGAALGDIAGSAARQAIGAAQPGEEDITPMERVGQAAMSAGAGLLGGAVAPVVKGAVGVVRRNLGTMGPKLEHMAAGVARDVGDVGGAGTSRLAAEATDETLGTATRAEPMTKKEIRAAQKRMGPSGRAGAQAIPAEEGITVVEYARIGDAVEDRLSKAINEPFAFSQGQRTGSARLLSKERVAAQSPLTVDIAQRQANTRARQLEKFADTVIERIAKNPESLDRVTQTHAAVGAVKRTIGDMRKARSESVGALFQQAEKEAAAGGNLSWIKADNTKEQITKELDILGFGSPGKFTSALKQDLEALEIEKGTGRLNAARLQKLLQQWGKRANGSVKTIEGLSPSEEQALAGRVLGALKRDLDAAVDSGKPGANTLRTAREMWAAHSDGIKAAANATVTRILKIAPDAPPEQVFREMSSMAPSRLRGFMTLIDEADIDTGNNLRGMFLKDMLEQAGKSSGNALGTATRTSTMSPAKLATLRAKNEATLGVLFKNPEHKVAVRDLFEATGRLALQPGFAGSDTYPKIAESLIQRYGGATASVVRQLLGDGAFGNEKVAQYLMTKEGTKAFSNMVRAASKPKTPAQHVLRAAKRLAAHSAILQARPTPETETFGGQQ